MEVVFLRCGGGLMKRLWAWAKHLEIRWQRQMVSSVTEPDRPGSQIFLGKDE